MLTQEDLHAIGALIKAEGDAIRKDMATKQDVERVDMKIEAVHEYQKKAHAEIMEKLVESNELNGQEVKKLEKRVERIEKHLDLPSLLEHDV